jgi:hypothetical protein
VTDTSLPVLVAPVPNPMLGRVETRVAFGMTIADIIATVMPQSAGEIRVYIVGAAGVLAIEPNLWRVVRPKVGTRIVIRPVPAGNVLKNVLQIVVVIAAVALGQLWAPAVAGALGISTGTAAALITAGVTVIGSLLLNALIPPPKPSGAQNPNYSISGFRNQANPDGPVPVPFGEIRYAPPYAALPYTEIVGNVQYIRALFVWGYGQLGVSDLKIGDTLLSEYDEFQVETYSGLPTDPQVRLYPQQVLEEAQNIELTRAWALDDAGNLLVPNHTIEKSWVRYTASDVTEAAVIFGFPGGLMHMSGSGQRNNWTVLVRIRQRPLGSTDTWTDVVTCSMTDASSVPIWRQFRWVLPSRGAWEIELTRMSDESRDTAVSDRVVWQALQSFRPEYPINFPHPVAVTAMRVKATAQLNGNLDTLTAVVRRYAPDWDQATQTWITRPTRSPASALRWALQGPALAYPLLDSELDLDLLADWAEWCSANGLYYDRVHDQEGSIGDAVRDIAHAGRASIRHDGVKTGVVIDRPQSTPVDEISARNSRDFKWKRAYPKRPDGFRITFNDSSNSYHKGERIVPWPGHTGSIDVTEELSLPGKVDPEAIWIEARRKAYEVDLRPDVFTVTQDGAAGGGGGGGRGPVSV